MQKRLLVTYRAGLTVLAPDDGTIRTEPDRSLSEREFYLDAALIEHQQVDCVDPRYGACSCAPTYEALSAIKAEQERREAADVYVEDPDEPTLEERLGPYGIEWQLEQRERTEGGW